MRRRGTGGRRQLSLVVGVYRVELLKNHQRDCGLIGEAEWPIRDLFGNINRLTSYHLQLFHDKDELFHLIL